MSRSLKRLARAIGLALTLSSPASAAEVYQWTDLNGVVNFSDNLDLVPQSARSSSSFVVRQDLVTVASSTVEVSPIAPEPLTKPEAERTAEVMPTPAEVTPVFYAPQELTIVVVNSFRHPKKHGCGGGGPCKRVFRPDFNDRQYIHPSVFSGGSRQYIHPR